MNNIEVGASTVETPEDLFAKMDLIIEGLKVWCANDAEPEIGAILIHRAQELHADFDVLDDNNTTHWQAAGARLMVIRDIIRQGSINDLNSKLETETPDHAGH